MSTSTSRVASTGRCSCTHEVRGKGGAGGPNPNQLTLDFKGRAAEKQKTRAGPRAKASPVRKAPAGIDIPKKPGD